MRHRNESEKVDLIRYAVTASPSSGETRYESQLSPQPITTVTAIVVKAMKKP